MYCDRCGERTRVVNTRANPPEGRDEEWTAKNPIIRRAECAVGWYTGQWVTRIRKCAGCECQVDTVEISIEDLQAMLDAADRGEAP